MDPRVKRWTSLPQELRSRKQWCVAGPDKAPWFFGDGLAYKADTTNPNSWMTFEEAVKWALHYNGDIGYVLYAMDPFTCIDFDIKDASNAPLKPNTWTTSDEVDEYLKAIEAFNSFTERSRSGKGFHIWVIGTIDKALKKRTIEVYNKERFIICTGNIVRDVAIADRSQMVQAFVNYYRGKDAEEEQLLLKDEPESEDDWSIVKRMHSGRQCEKFERLWTGQIDDYPSQSEADASLMQIIVFYTNNNTQAGRIFLSSALGKRQKAQERNFEYVRRTLARARSIRNRELRAEQLAIEQAMQLKQDVESGKAVNLDAEVARRNAQAVKPSREQDSIFAGHVASQHASDPLPTANAAMLTPTNKLTELAGEDGIPWPPGIMGEIAKFIFNNSVRPVKEVALVSAIGFMAGICGKAWHIPQSGLNMYTVLVAQSGVGKEAMHTGISTLMASVYQHDPKFEHFQGFFDFNEYASGPALSRRCSESKSFVNVMGEWGRRLKRMAYNDTDGPLSTLRTAMTNLYQKSGPQSVVAGIGYSDSEKNVKSSSGVAYSMIGETTPKTYYEALTPSMMEDGFLSRFLMIEYKGIRPPANKRQIMRPTDALVSHIYELARTAYKNNETSSVLVKADDAAQHLITEFDNMCDSKINSTDDESYRQMWNRASLKSIRLAALLAVGDNYKEPRINAEHVKWAQHVIQIDIGNMDRRLREGDIGTDERSREMKLVSVIRSYIEELPGPTYGIDSAMRTDMIIPRNYLHIRLANANTFTGAREGYKQALDNAIRLCIDNGYLSDVPKIVLADKYSFTGKAYLVLKLPQQVQT